MLQIEAISPLGMPEGNDQLTTFLRSYAPGELIETTVAAIAQYFTLQKFPSNHSLTRQGTPGYEMYLILSGRAEVRWYPIGHTTSPDLMKVLATIGPGELVGEMSLIFDKPRNADVVTLTETFAYKLSKRDWIHLSSHYEGFRSRVEQIARIRAGLATAPDSVETPVLEDSESWHHLMSASRQAVDLLLAPQVNTADLSSP